MAENEFSIYDLLDKIRLKPLLYLVYPSITRLYMYVSGYRHALLETGWEDVTAPSLQEFHFWARARLGQDRSSYGWMESILEACGGDEALALTRFYEMLDEYRNDQFPGLVERWEAEWDAIWEARWEAEAEQENQDE